MMKKKILLAALTVMWAMTTTVFTACTDQTDNPVVPGPQADTYAFTDEMDPGTKPGDDFFRYVLGSWLDQYPYDKYGYQGTMALQGQQGSKWLGGILNEDCPDPAVAELFRRVKTAEDDFDKNIALLHAKTDAIAALDNREDVLKTLGQLLGWGYNPGLAYYITGNAEMISVYIGFKVFSVDDKLDELLLSMGYSPEETKQLLTLAEPFIKTNDENTDEEEKFTNYRYWFNPDHVRKAIPYMQSKARVRQAAQGYVSSDLILDGMGVVAKDVLLVDEDAEKCFEHLDYYSSISEGLEVLKAVMQLSVVKCDANYINVKTPKALQNIIYKGFNVLNYQLSQLYVEQNVTAADREYVIQMCEEFRSALARRIERLDWMTDATKQRALQKLEAVYFFVGYPDEWDVSFNLPAPTDDGTLYEAMTLLQQQYNQQKINLLPGPCNYDKVLSVYMDSFGSWAANAFNAPDFNYVNILASNLIAPICDRSLGDAYNYAVIGAQTIGHELTHGFDSSGSNYDEMGRLSDWWTEEDKAVFVGKQQELIDHFNAYEALPGVYLNGANTITENIADLGGLETGLDILIDLCHQQGFSQSAINEQIRVYLLSYAYGWKSNANDNYVNWQIKNDVHSPERWRTNAQVNNIDQWYTIFDVRTYQKLYVDPSKRVHIW